MSLLIDSDQITAQDLTSVDPEITEIADAEGITIDGAGGIIRETWSYCADELLEALQCFGSGQYGSIGSLLFSGMASQSRARAGLNQIVVTSAYAHRTGPVKRWMAGSALVKFYEAAINRRANDRYESKLARASANVAKYWSSLYALGIPVVASPLACPGAIHGISEGEWGWANVSTVAGGAQVETIGYDVAITWTSAQYVSPSNKQNAESGSSALVTASLDAGQVIRIDINSLTPPGSVPYQGGTADFPYASRTASGWNVYVGLFGGPSLYLQNGSPIPIATKTYALSAAPVLSGSALTSGQVADGNQTLQAIWQRG